MGNDNTKPFTEQGIKQIYLSLLLVIPFCIVIFLTAFSPAVAFGVTFVICIVILLIIYLRGMGDMLSGREELGEKHTSNVVLSTILSSAAIIVFLFLIVTLIISVGLFTSALMHFSLDAYGSYLFSIGMSFCLFLAFRILIGLAFVFYIEVIIPEKKQLLWISFFSFVLAPFALLIPIDIIQVICALTLITFILPVMLYVYCYRIAYQKLCCSEIKAAPLVPCPFCNVMIPAESTSCKHCGTEFEEREDLHIDPRLTMELPKQKYASTPGYTPVKGPTEEQKKRLFRLIALIIAIIVTISIVVLAFQMLSGEDTSDTTNELVGTWQGGMFDGEGYGTDKTWVFYANNSLKEEDDFGITWYTYYTEDTNGLCKEDTSISFLMCYNYELTNSGGTLSLSMGGSPMYRFNRVQ